MDRLVRRERLVPVGRASSYDADAVEIVYGFVVACRIATWEQLHDAERKARLECADDDVDESDCNA